MEIKHKYLTKIYQSSQRLLLIISYDRIGSEKPGYATKMKRIQSLLCLGNTLPAQCEIIFE